MERLTAKRAETLRKPGRYQAGDTVYLVVAKGRTGRVNKRWVQRLHVQRKRRDISIGTYPAVTLSEARERAHGNRLTAKRGGDPSGRPSTVPTFAEVSAKVDQGGQWRGRTRETAAADPGAVRGASHGSTRRPDRPGGRALGARAGLPRQARDRKALAWLGPGRARRGAGSRTCRRERGGRSDRRGIAEDPEDPRASAGVGVRGRFPRRWRRSRRPGRVRSSRRRLASRR